jgi:hypothetical protein
MNGKPLYVSVVAPITPAIERVKTILLRPFDVGKWFVIGFCAWLAELGRTQGSNNPGGGGNGDDTSFHGGQYGFEGLRDSILAILAKTQDYVMSNLDWIAPAAIAAIILAVLVTWLSSRGRFMFLHCVVENKGHFSLYILFQIAIWTVIAILIMAIVLLTFCIAALVLGIPYIGTVLLLPIYVFQRSYSLYFFRQFGPSFDVFAHGEESTLDKCLHTIC